jgi:hypothetical protein
VNGQRDNHLLVLIVIAVLLALIFLFGSDVVGR